MLSVSHPEDRKWKHEDPNVLRLRLEPFFRYVND